MISTVSPIPTSPIPTSPPAVLPPATLPPTGSSHTSSVRDFFDRHKLLFACIIAVLLPIKLSYTYLVFIPFVMLWIAARGLSQCAAACAMPLFAPLVTFIVIAAVSALFGLDPLHSLRCLFSLSFVVLSVPAFAEAMRERRGYLVPLILLCSQSMSAYWGAISASTLEELPRLFNGRVTESGQLALTLPIAVGFLLSLIHGRGPHIWKIFESPHHAPPRIREVMIAVVHSIVLCLMGFAPALSIPAWAVVLLFILSVALIGRSLIRCRRMLYDTNAIVLMLLQVVLPLLITGLLVNLKRGPWSGICVAVGVLLALYARRFLVPALVIASCLALSITPIRHRLAESSRDFFIYGGRNVLWHVGAELSSKYPLGIGFANSSFLQHFSVQIPSELTHFHNNGLNIQVETGWLGFCGYVWWVISLLTCAFSRRSRASPLIAGIGCGILSWQIAGMVEYNVGDSEVMIVVYLITGMLMALSGTQKGVEDCPLQ